MKVLVIRINKGEVSVRGKVVSSVSRGVAVFVGIEKGDNDSILEEMAEKITNLRIFENEQEKLNYSLKDTNYQILCISNFTLCANTNKGRRPSFEEAMPKEEANKFFDNFVLLLKARKIDVKTGIFGEYMDINLDFDGPVNIIIEIPVRMYNIKG
jgi:D-tyrosyl-tRNA(Tyr) deacylase